MSTTRRGILLVLAVALCIVPSAHAHRQDRGLTVRPADRVAGVTGGQLLAESWARILSTPAAENPFIGNGGPAAACLRLGPEGRIFSPAIAGVPRPTECTVEVGTPVFIIGFTNECSSVEISTNSEATQLKCAVNADRPAKRILLAVDGGPAVDIRSPRFELRSRQQSVVLPTGNLFDNPPGSVPGGTSTTFTAHAWAGKIKRLAPGRHTISGHVVFTDGNESNFTVVLNVTGDPGDDHDDD